MRRAITLIATLAVMVLSGATGAWADGGNGPDSADPKDAVMDLALTVAWDVTFAPLELLDYLPQVAANEICREREQTSYFPVVGPVDGEGLGWSSFTTTFRFCYGATSRLITSVDAVPSARANNGLVYKGATISTGGVGTSCAEADSTGHFNDSATDSVELWSPHHEFDECV